MPKSAVLKPTIYFCNGKRRVRERLPHPFLVTQADIRAWLAAGRFVHELNVRQTRV